VVPLKKSESESVSEHSHFFFSGLNLTLTLTEISIFKSRMINDLRDFVFWRVTKLAMDLFQLACLLPGLFEGAFGLLSNVLMCKSVHSAP